MKNLKFLKKRRKPKPKPLYEVPKQPKKRGRKPKEKVYSIDQKILHKKPKEYNILFIPIHSNDINTDDELMTDQILRYNPDLNIPEPYEPNYKKIFLCEETISKNIDTEQLGLGEEPI